jgi:thiol:disulfide interchange protein DsbC
MKKLLTTAIAALALSIAAGTHADESSLRATLEKRMSGVKIGKISPAPVPGLFEVVVNGLNVVYTDKKGDFAFIGNLVDLKTQQSLTKKRAEELAYVDFSKIPPAQAIVKVKGDGSRKLAVFSDPDCPYCKQLEKELAFVDNVTIYVMLLPLEQLHPDARKKAEAVWCSADRAKTWDDLMLYGKAPAAPQGECKTPIDDIRALAESLSINGTPGLVFQNGKLVPGEMKTEQIEAMLTAAGKS